MSKSVKHARFHSSIFVPGLADLGYCVPIVNKSIPLALSLEDNGLLIKGRGSNGQPMEVLIPTGNLALVVFENESGS